MCLRRSWCGGSGRVGACQEASLEVKEEGATQTARGFPGSECGLSSTQSLPHCCKRRLHLALSVRITTLPWLRNTSPLGISLRFQSLIACKVLLSGQICNTSVRHHTSLIFFVTGGRSNPSSGIPTLFAPTPLTDTGRLPVPPIS